MLSEELLSAYLDGELDATTRAAVEAALADSEEWRTVLADVRAVREAVRALPMREAPAGFWSQLVAEGNELPAEPEVATGGRRRARAALRRPRLRPVWAASGAAVAAVSALAFVLPSEGTVRPPVASMVRSHAASASEGSEPISQLAPVAQPVHLGP